MWAKGFGDLLSFALRCSRIRSGDFQVVSSRFFPCACVVVFLYKGSQNKTRTQAYKNLPGQVLVFSYAHGAKRIIFVFELNQWLSGCVLGTSFCMAMVMRSSPSSNACASARRRHFKVVLLSSKSSQDFKNPWEVRVPHEVEKHRKDTRQASISSNIHEQNCGNMLSLL